METCVNNRPRQRGDDRHVRVRMGMRRSRAVYKRTCKIHETCPFTLTRLYWAGRGEREPIDRAEYQRTFGRCEHSCVRGVLIRTKSYYPRIDVCKCRRLQFGFVRGGDRSFARATPSLFMERSNLWLFISAVFVECLFVEFHCGLKR